MGEPYYAEIRIWANTFAPYCWAYCDGQSVAIAQNQALYAVMGTAFGGDGRITFAMPDLQGRAPVAAGQGPYTQNRMFAGSYGSLTTRLTTSQIPVHSHGAIGLAEVSKQNQADSASYLAIAYDTTPNQVIHAYRTPEPDETLVSLNEYAMASAGGGTTHFNAQPALTLNYCIAFDGIFPSRP